MTNVFKYCLSMVLVTVMASHASASTVTAVMQQYEGGNIRVQQGGDAFFAGAGAFSWELLGDDADSLKKLDVGSQFISFCIEAGASIWMNTPYEYAVVSPESAPNSALGQLGQARADLLGSWFGAYYQGGKISDWSNIDAIAFQMGVWEIVSETSNDFDLFDGDFQILNQPSARALAQSWLDDPAWREPGADRLKLAALTSVWGDLDGNYQDQIMVISTPLPSAVLGGAMLFGGMAVVARWRRKQQASCPAC